MKKLKVARSLTICPPAILLSVGILIAILSCDSQPAESEGELIFSDDFNATDIDMSKWTWFLGFSGPKYREAYYTREDAYTENGNLVFRIRRNGDLYKTSWLTTKNKFSHKYGYWEIRCKFSEMEAKGYWVAFWLFGDDNKVYDGNPNTGCEIDIIEYAWMDERTNHSVHCGRSRSMSTTHIQRTPELRRGFHTFGLEWKMNEYIYYIDGREIWRTDKLVSQAPLTIYLSVEIEAGTWGDGGNIRNHIDQLPDYWYVDYVRVYRQKPRTTEP